MRSILAIICALSALPALARDFQRAHLYSYAGSQGTEEEPSITGAGGMAVAPMPVNFLSGMTVFEAGGRGETGAGGSTGHTRLGFTYFQHVAEGVPNFRVAALRYGSTSGRSVTPVVEGEAILQGNDADSRWLRVVPGFRSRVGVGARTTQIPGALLTAEPVLEWSLEQGRRWLIELVALRSAELRYTGGAKRQWATFLRADSAPFFTTSDDLAWVKTSERRAVIGGRINVGRDWFVALSAGRLERADYTGLVAELSLQNWKSMP